MLTEARLKELMSYNPETGWFTNLVSRGRAGAVGTLAGHIDAAGYICMYIDGSYQRAHRLAFLYMTGKFPPHDVDHRNRIRSDNRWSNIRPATEGENMQNKSLARNNTTGKTGVSLDKRSGKYQVQFKVNGKTHYRGVYTTFEEACRVADEAKAELHPFQPTSVV